MASFSLYNRSTQGTSKNFPQASEEHKVTIEFVDESGVSLLGIPGFTAHNYGTVVGYLNKEFEGTATGNYTNVFNVQSFSDSLVLNILKDETQANVANYGLLTKKVYTQGESPTLNIDFRCWSGDWENEARCQEKVKDKFIYNSHPVKIANALINATLPRVGKNAVLNAKNFSNLPILDQTGKGLSLTGQLIANPIDRENNPNVAKASENANASIDKGMEQAANLTLNDLISRKPPLCNVRVGNIFEKDMMVIKQVDYKFSKEYINPGEPLYGDFSIVLQSLFNASTLEDGTSEENERIFGSGLNRTNSRNRVSFDV